MKGLLGTFVSPICIDQDECMPTFQPRHKLVRADRSYRLNSDQSISRGQT